MLSIKMSRFGLGFAVSFWLMALLAFGFHTWSVFFNPANSGESAILLLPFALPWINWIPADSFTGWLWEGMAMPGWWMLVLVNTGLIYGICGGIGWKKR